LVQSEPIGYPSEAKARRIEGTVEVLAKVDARGDVQDARVLYGPDDLRKGVLQSILNWRFTPEWAGSVREIAVIFRLGAGPQTAPLHVEPDGPAPPDSGVGFGLNSAPPPPVPAPIPPGSGVPRIRVDGAEQQRNLVSQIPHPVYPPLARSARVQGRVRFQAVIGVDGHVQDPQLLSGPPLLVRAALDSVQHWIYKPTLVDGKPVEVITTIDVDFTLADQ